MTLRVRTAARSRVPLWTAARRAFGQGNNNNNNTVGPSGPNNSGSGGGDFMQQLGAMMQMQQQAMAQQGGGGNNSNQQSPFGNMMGMFEEREWECWCGHKFRAPGEWVPCAPVQCMAPGCPNPGYFLEGEGRQLLERQDRGEKILPPSQRGAAAAAAQTTVGGSTHATTTTASSSAQQQEQQQQQSAAASSAPSRPLPATRAELERWSVRDLKAALAAAGKGDPTYAEKRDYVDAVWRLRA